MLYYTDLDLNTIKLETVYKYNIHTKSVATYYNIECGFDIETTSTYVDGEKQSFMYEWTFGIKDTIVYGRTWEEFIDLCFRLQKHLHLSSNRILIKIGRAHV